MTQNDFTRGCKIGFKLALSGYLLVFAALCGTSVIGLLLVGPIVTNGLDLIWGTK